MLGSGFDFLFDDNGDREAHCWHDFILLHPSYALRRQHNENVTSISSIAGRFVIYDQPAPRFHYDGALGCMNWGIGLPWAHFGQLFSIKPHVKIGFCIGVELTIISWVIGVSRKSTPDGFSLRE